MDSPMIREGQVITEKYPDFWLKPRPLSFSFLGKGKGTEYIFSHKPQTCRTYLNEVLYKEDHKTYNHLRTNPEFLLEKNNTVLFVTYNWSLGKARLLGRIKKLNQLEKKFGIAETQISFVEKSVRGIAFFGDKRWQSALWKLTIYSFLIKNILHPTLDMEYTMYKKLLDINLETLLSKIIDTKYKDVIPKGGDIWMDVHVKSGFVSICSGNNPTMAELLGVKKVEFNYNTMQVEEL